MPTLYWGPCLAKIRRGGPEEGRAFLFQHLHRQENVICKGQKVSKANFFVLISSKKEQFSS